MAPAPALRVLAFDFGAKRIGLAFGQELGGVARELPLLAARSGVPDWKELERQLEEWNPTLLLIGLPLHITGEPSELSARARRFGRQLHERFGLPCEMVDERLTTVEARRELQPRDAARFVDSAAARIIAEDWLRAHELQRPKIERRLAELRERIAAAQSDAKRAVRLVGASKGQGPGTILNAWRLGLRDFGENRLDEALGKIGALRGLERTLHFLGAVQSNKTAAVAEHFDWVHSVSREKIARRLSEQRDPQKPPLQVCLQLNTSGEEQKEGVRTFAELCELAGQVEALPRLQLRGLMALPQPESEPARQYDACCEAAEAFSELQQSFPELDTLSLGTSADFESAIRAGANLARIGGALFGPRSKTTLP